MNISIIGIGEVGSVIAALLISDFNHIQLNLIDIRTDISGRILDLKHAASVQNIKITVNNQAVLTTSDFIVFTAGFSNSKGKDRNTVATHNKRIVKQIFDGIKLKEDTKIIVVTNPVEVVSQLISELFNHKYLVIGTGTALDTYRLKYLLASKCKTDIANIKSLVLGEHGQCMTPIFSKCFAHNKCITDILTSVKLDELTIELKNAATTIRYTEKATKYGVSQIVCLIIKALCTDKEIKMPVSILINEYYKNLLSITENIFMSLPTKISKNTVAVLGIEDLQKAELFSLQQAAKALVNVHQSL